MNKNRFYQTAQPARQPMGKNPNPTPKAGKKTALCLLSNLLILQACAPSYAAQLTDLETSSLSQDNLPAEQPEKELSSWLLDISEHSHSPEPEKIDQASANFEGSAPGALPVAQSSQAISPPAEPTKQNEDLLAQASGERISADPLDRGSAIEDLTRQILLKEIELERFNLRYKQNSAKQGRWKGWRYATANEANSMLGLAGGITSVYNRGIHVHRSNQVKVGLQENANTLSMIGNIIGAGAAAAEFSINAFHELEAHQKGFSPGQAKKHISEITSEMNRMLAERAALVKLEQAAPLLSPQAKVYELEGRVLEDLRDQSLLEFQRFHLGARRLLAFQQMQYFFDLSKNATGAIGANFAYLSLHRGRRVWNYRAGVLFTISGALTMGGPIASRLFAKAVSEYHRYGLKETLQGAEDRELAKLEHDKAELERLCKENRDTCDVAQAALQRTESYGIRSKIFQDQEQSASKQLDRAKLVATQNIGASLYTGGSRVASGILFIIPGYLHLYNTKKSQTATRITNSLLLTSGIVGLPASAFAIADTLRIQVRGEYDRHKLAKAGKLPGQLIQARLEQLDETEAKLLGK